MRITLLTALLAVIAFPAMATEVEFKPVAELVTEQPRACPGRFDNIKLPVITWGGDVQIVHANGSSRTTASGSLFDDAGLNVELILSNDPVDQLKSYMACETPFMRLTLGMAAAMTEVTQQSAESSMIPFYQLSWSAGGDTVVGDARKIRRVTDWSGKTLGLQYMGPHMDFILNSLADAGIDANDVNIKWYKGLSDAPEALRNGEIDLAAAILPDAFALTSGGEIGNGAEGSVRGAGIRLTTADANRVIADLLIVRSDYAKSNPDQIAAISSALFKANEQLEGKMPPASVLDEANPDSALEEFVSGNSAIERLIDSSADILGDDSTPLGTLDIVGMWADMEAQGYADNVEFFANASNPRGAQVLFNDADDYARNGVQTIYKSFGLLGVVKPLDMAHNVLGSGFDYAALAVGLTNTAAVEVPRFSADEKGQAAANVARLRNSGRLDEFTPFNTKVYFEPNQSSFSVGRYIGDFEEIVDRATTYQGALIVVSGHADPSNWLHAQQNSGTGKQAARLLRLQEQQAFNLSQGRAQSFVDSVIAYASDNGIRLDSSVFLVEGLGYTEPSKGMCGNVPCVPETSAEKADERRVEVKVVSILAE